MSAPNYNKTRFACFFAYLAMASVFVFPALLFTTFRELYHISFTLPGTLILMEEKIPSPGVAAYALMAACGDFGASVAPQLMGIVVDNVAVSRFAAEMSQSSGMTVEEIGLKVGMLIASLFPIAGVGVGLYIKRYYAKKTT